MVTAYDYPSAVHLDTAAIDICLVGDSASMVVHGHDTTLPITLDEMLVHCRAVARGAKTPLLVGDLPFGTYECSSKQAKQGLGVMVLCCNDDDIIGSLQCLLSKLFPPYFNVPTCNYGKAVALFNTVPFDPGPLESSPHLMEMHPSHCSSVFTNKIIGCIVAPSFKLPCDHGFSDCGTRESKTMVLILAATFNRDLTVIINGGYLSDTFVEVFSNFNAQLQIDVSVASSINCIKVGASIVDFPDHGRVFTAVRIDDKSISYFNSSPLIPANKLLEGGKGGTFHTAEEAVDAAVRILKEGGMDAIKLEGGSPSRIVAAKAIVEAGIAVIGHVGLTPQAISVLGGFRPQGRNVASAVKVVETALALQEAGCFAVVLECVLVYHDLLGMLQHPHHAKVTPKFCKQYARVGDVINKALVDYKEDVINGSFPDAQHSPYKISETDANGFLNELQKLGFDKAASATSEAVQKMVTNKVII
ncbi:hypothetical protein TSUD_361240 [Trifolium subterraneum]|uniref:3-methyl-2-oxobutanoate hydroxymethyltransferase n=1 Tax=Trifolium subterraneum TaxID=3900 RepID=A0A2Z6M315_TRISU|nr:hypothetical protein TSUD_361240 [Trifolium subterraneum]